MPKKVGQNIYQHRDWVKELPRPMRTLLDRFGSMAKNMDWNVVKIATDDSSVSFSRFDEFEDLPHPPLVESLHCDPNGGKATKSTYHHLNPPILHRKELLVGKSHARYEQFAAMTRAEEEAGLLAAGVNHRIGHSLNWYELLEDKGLMLVGHEVRSATGLCKSEDTALSATSPESPLARWVAEQVRPGEKVFDWGSGKGRNIKYLQSRNISVIGWDPSYCNEVPPEDIIDEQYRWVLCSFVLNTLRYPQERLRVLQRIYRAVSPGTHLALCVRSRRDGKKVMKNSERCNDGWLTSKGTFQVFMGPDYLEELTTKAGFRTVRRVPLGSATDGILVVKP